MDSTKWLAEARLLVDEVRDHYLASGQEDEFDGLVERFRGEGRWPFTG
jgi:hypothetical protein